MYKRQPGLVTHKTHPMFAMHDAINAFKVMSCVTATLSTARSTSKARTLIFNLPVSILRMISAMDSIASGALNKFTTARVCASALFNHSRCAVTTCGGSASGLASMSKLRAYGAAISPISNFLLSVLPMPSRTLKALCNI